LSRILILDGHSAASLAVTRSAGRAGHWIAVGANRGIFAVSKHSRYCRAQLDYPVSTDRAEDFARNISDYVRANRIDLVLPMTDWTMGPLAKHRVDFRDLCLLAVPSDEALRIAGDKYETVRMAQAEGISTPGTWLITSATDLDHVPDIAFPAVVKDRFSVRWMGDKAVFGSVSYAYSRVDLESQVAKRLAAAGDVLVQEFVSGRGVGFSCFVVGGEVYLPFQWQRIREVDPRGSASSARKSIPLDPAMVAASSALITRIGFEGIAMVEYKQAGAGGVPILMEINGRPWGSIALPIASGIDYPRYLIDWYLQRSLPPKVSAYQDGVTCRRAVGELSHLANVRAGKPAGWPGAYPSFWPTLLRVAVPWYPGMHYDELSLSDPRPGVAEIGNWLRTRMARK
jgi:predicted ATP-grasp superfamily ATP-dependent carboligase